MNKIIIILYNNIGSPITLLLIVNEEWIGIQLPSQLRQAQENIVHIIYTCCSDNSQYTIIVSYDGPVMINGDLTLVLKAIKTGANVQSQIEHSLIYNDVTAFI